MERLRLDRFELDGVTLTLVPASCARRTCG
jgi:hypothetical protein